MIAVGLFRNPRLLLLVLVVSVAAGWSALEALPRMEDPILSRRVAVVTTAYPGASATQVEALVTSRLEQRLRNISEVKELLSSSRAGVSSVVLELRDEVTDVEPVWSRVRDQLNDAVADLPDEALAPNFERLELKAYAALLSVKWERTAPANLAILQRIAAAVGDRIRNLEGVEVVDLYGAPRQEILVEANADALARLGLSCGALAQQLQQSAARQPAGALDDRKTRLLLDASHELSSARRLEETPIRVGPAGPTVNLGEIAEIRAQAVDDDSLAVIDGKRAVVIAALASETGRIDRWSQRLREEVRRIRAQLPDGVEAELFFSQSQYVQQRLNGLFWNLLQGMAAVILVVLTLMGWRSTLVVSLALPLSALLVLAGLRLLGVPLHQMSVTGLIIALGLLIDNAIVIVDEVRSRIQRGMDGESAIRDGVRHLRMPLFGSTLTTTLAFAPIALLPGPAGEFVGSIAISVILAVNASFLLAMTVIPAATGLLQGTSQHLTWLNHGISVPPLRAAYVASLDAVLRRPWLGVLLGGALPLCGFYLASTLPEQFFPQSNRDQIQIEIELPARSTLEQTRRTAEAVRRLSLQQTSVQRVDWFLGRSAPTFFYNVVPRRRAAPYYGQALVRLSPDADPRTVVRRLQAALDAEFTECRVLVRQLEQGPPFDAPIEIRLQGPDLAVLGDLGGDLRRIAAGTRHVLHTRSDLQESRPKIALEIDGRLATQAGLSREDIAGQVYAALEGVSGGEVLDSGEELPIRVRLQGAESLSAEQLGGLVLAPPPRRGPPPRGSAGPSALPGPPLGALAAVQLDAEPASIPRLNGQRMNEIKVYVTAGVLPSGVLAELEQRLEAAGWRVPPGYSMRLGGEFARRNEAAGGLVANAVVLFALMLVTLVASFRSFRAAAIITAVGGLSLGLGPGALWCFGYPFGFLAIVGAMGLVGVAINDAIVVLAGIRDDGDARGGDPVAIRRVVLGCTRHVLATTLTTMAGFAPLLLGGGRFWPPLAITIAGGVGGSTLLALYFAPSLYRLLGSKEEGVAVRPLDGSTS